VLDRERRAPHPWGVRDDQTTPGKSRPAQTGKDAKLAAALRANLARRKAAAREAAEPPAPLATDKDEENKA